MKRWHEEFPKTYQEWKTHQRGHVAQNSDPNHVDCVCDQQKGRFRKRNAGDCGNPRCQLCHSYKFPIRKKTNPELLAERQLKEEIDELNRL